MGGITGTIWATFQVELRASGLAVRSLSLRGNGINLQSDFPSQQSAIMQLRSGLAHFVCGLVSAFINAAGNKPFRRQMMKKFGPLILEDFHLQRIDKSKCIVKFRVTAGGALAVFEPSHPDSNSDSLSDVFLPLTNLSAYLHALSDGNQGPAMQAISLTADRVDEFLLAYGQRLRARGDVAYLTA